MLPCVRSWGPGDAVNTPENLNAALVRYQGALADWKLKRRHEQWLYRALVKDPNAYSAWNAALHEHNAAKQELLWAGEALLRAHGGPHWSRLR